jgi:hypothetical protein
MSEHDGRKAAEMGIWNTCKKIQEEIISKIRSC